MKKEKSEAVRIACVDNFSGSETVRHWMQMGGTWAAVTEQTAAKNGLEGSRLEDGRQYHMVRQITALLAASLAVYNRVYNFDLTMREGRKKML